MMKIYNNNKNITINKITIFKLIKVQILNLNYYKRNNKILISFKRIYLLLRN